MNKRFLLILLLLLNGCGQYSIRNIDKPPPQLHELWRKNGASFFEIRKSLLECGQVSLGRTTDQAYEDSGIFEKKEQVNHSFLVAKCMLNAGFIEQNTSWTLKDACANKRYRDYPACQPNAIIPMPSVARRLNSWHCKIETDYDYCLKHAVNPPACKPNDFKHPPPECQPPGQEFIPQKSSPAEMPAPDSDAYHYFEQNRFREQTDKLQQDMQNNSNKQMEKMLKDTAPKNRR